MTIKTIRIKRKSELTPQAEREVKTTIILISLFAAGMIIGAGIMRNSDTSELIKDFADIFDIFIQNRNTYKAYQIFLNSLSVNLLFCILIFSSGLSCIGIPIITATPIIKGIGCGMLAGYLFSVYKMTGIGFYLITIFPGAIISVATLMMSCCTSLLMSADMLAVILSKKQSERKTISVYLKRYLVCIVTYMLSSAIDTVLTKAFSYLFTF